MVSLVLPALLLRLLCLLRPWDSYTTAHKPFAFAAISRISCSVQYWRLLWCFGETCVCVCGRVAPPTRPALALRCKLPPAPRVSEKDHRLLIAPPSPLSQMHCVPLRCRCATGAARCNLPRVLSSSCLHGLLQCISLRCALGQAANAGDHSQQQLGIVCFMSHCKPRVMSVNAACMLVVACCPARVTLFNKLTTHFFAQSW